MASRLLHHHLFLRGQVEVCEMSRAKKALCVRLVAGPSVVLRALDVCGVTAAGMPLAVSRVEVLQCSCGDGGGGD